MHVDVNVVVGVGGGGGGRGGSVVVFFFMCGYPFNFPVFIMQASCSAMNRYVMQCAVVKCDCD